MTSLPWWLKMWTAVIQFFSLQLDLKQILYCVPNNSLTKWSLSFIWMIWHHVAGIPCFLFPRFAKRKMEHQRLQTGQKNNNNKKSQVSKKRKRLFSAGFFFSNFKKWYKDEVNVWWTCQPLCEDAWHAASEEHPPSSPSQHFTTDGLT